MMSSRALQMILGVSAITVLVTAESCEDGQCMPTPQATEVRGISLMQSGRSVMPAASTKLLSHDFDDSADEFANMEDEFDDGAVQPRAPADFSTVSAKDIAAPDHGLRAAPLPYHVGHLSLYAETLLATVSPALLVIAFFALAAKGIAWAQGRKASAKASVQTVDLPADATATTKVVKADEHPPIFVQGGSQNFPALEQAVRQGDEAKCVELLKQGGRWAVRQEDPCGCTALHVAAHCGSAAMASLLLSHGAKVDACEAWEETPLHIAARTGSLEVCEVLLAKGASIDEVNAHGLTPLLLAGHAQQEAVCELLLCHGAGAGGIADTELPPMVNALIFRRMFTGAVPRSVADVNADDSETPEETCSLDSADE